jgi:hypothetical protein
MGDRSLREPTEYVIWASAALLAVILGAGVAFGAWTALRQSANAPLAGAGVVTIGAGLAIVGLAVERPIYRAFFVIFAIGLVAAYLLGGAEFARLLR